MSVCRIAWFLKCLPSEVGDIPAADVDMLMRYWGEEPWGAYRDNLHAAIIATEVRRTLTPGKKIDMTSFMIANPTRRAIDKGKALVATLRAMAGGVKKTPAEVKRRPSGRRRREND